MSEIDTSTAAVKRCLDEFYEDAAHDALRMLPALAAERDKLKAERDAERLRADAAEAEVARLRAQVAQVQAETWLEAAAYARSGTDFYPDAVKIAAHCEAQARATEAQGGGR